MDYGKVLQDAWSATHSGAVPEYVRKRFQAEVVPTLGNALPSDPYVQEHLQRIFLDNRLNRSADILEENASAGESLVSLVGKVQTAKVVFQVGGVFVAGIIAAIIGLAVAFTAGGAAADGWNRYRIAKVEAEARIAEADAEYRTERLAFLQKVNADLMTCKDGTIEIRNGKKVCFYEKNGWFIE